MTLQPHLQAADWRETAHTWQWPHADPTHASTTLGILSLPKEPSRPQSTGVLILSGGAQTRWGAHRQFVQLARHCATQGWPTLRFDWPGLGDASGPSQSFDTLTPLVEHATARFFELCPHLRHVVLFGLCDGASVALLHAQLQPDSRISGLALLNPWLRTEESLARTRLEHYYWTRLRQPEFWRKLLWGGVGRQALVDLWHNLRTGLQQTPPSVTSWPDQMSAGWRQFPGPILVVIGDQDTTGQEFLLQVRDAPRWRTAWMRQGVTWTVLPGADHTCSLSADQTALAGALTDWLRDHQAPSERLQRPSM